MDQPSDLQSGAVSPEEGIPLPPPKKSRKPPKKSDAAATAAAELEREIQESERNKGEEEGGDDDAEASDDKPAAVKSENAKGMLVDHTYTNYAIFSDKELRMLDENPSLLPEPKSEEERMVREKLSGMTCTYGPMKKSAGGVVQPFPGKVSELYHIS